jgi:TnsA endonuclease N terminal
MRPVSGSGRIITYSKVGLMILSEHFRQRKIETTFGSFRSMIPLSTPSGPQNVESELEADLLRQLAFAPGVFDIITQPIIEYSVDGKARQYTPDVAVQLHASRDDLPCRYLVEAKRRADLDANTARYAIKFEAARMACEALGAAFRIMDETQIRTPYLGNAKMLARRCEGDPDFSALDILRSMTNDIPLTVQQGIELLVQHGLAEFEAREGIEEAVAWRMVDFDLMRPFDDASIIRTRPPGKFRDRNDDPFLRSLHEADSA